MPDPELNPAQITQDPLSLAPEGEAPAAPPVGTTAPPTPAELEELRAWRREHEPLVQRLPDLQERLSAYEQREQEQQIEAAVQGWVNEYINEGVPPDRARALAEKHLGLLQQERQRVNAEVRKMQAGQARQMYAERLAQAHGLDRGAIRKLLRARTPQDMEDIAAELKEETGRWKQLEQDRKGRVAAQNFESGVGGGGGTSHAAYLQSLKEGKPLPTSDEIDRIVAQAMRQG